MHFWVREGPQRLHPRLHPRRAPPRSASGLILMF
nr:MAG TPA: hypothetical protein [Caudoviricetes sp.]DAR43674.1 MAG TPA: hypothetical protein [Caudoviricetes sp.]